MAIIRQELENWRVSYASLVALMVKKLPAVWETWVQSLGWEDPLGDLPVFHSSILAWRIPMAEEPGGLESMESQRVGHNWVTTLTLTQLNTITLIFLCRSKFLSCTMSIIEKFSELQFVFKSFKFMINFARYIFLCVKFWVVRVFQVCFSTPFILLFSGLPSFWWGPLSFLYFSL